MLKTGRKAEIEIICDAKRDEAIISYLWRSLPDPSDGHHKQATHHGLHPLVTYLTTKLMQVSALLVVLCKVEDV
jgi:hypothetical protein